MTAKEAPVRGLHAKLAEVMAEAERIPKNGTAPAAMGGFKFVQVGDAADAIRKALGDRGVSMLPSAVEVVGEAEHQTSNNKTMTTLTVRTTWTLVDGGTGETAVIQSLGSGADTGDKAAPKAQSNAMKYALLMGFLLSTGDDPEQHDTSDRAPRETIGGESLELLGNLQKAGTITAGGSAAYKLEWRETPDGHAIGFRLKLPDKDIPQVLLTGRLGEALHLTNPDGASLDGMHVTVKGKLYGVRQPGRATYYRLVVGTAETDFIETPDARIPALVDSEPPAGDEAQPEAASLPFDLEEVDRLAAAAT